MATKHDSTCLQKAGDDEPIFVLRAQDMTSPDCVQTWIDRNINRLGFNHPKIQAAIDTRDKMHAWPHRKQPD